MRAIPSHSRPLESLLRSPTAPRNPSSLQTSFACVLPLTRCAVLVALAPPMLLVLLRLIGLLLNRAELGPVVTVGLLLNAETHTRVLDMGPAAGGDDEKEKAAAAE